MSIAPSRHPNVPYRRVALTEAQAEVQHQRGLYTVKGGMWLPIPADSIKSPTVFLNRDMWREDDQGRIYRPGAKFEAPGSSVQQKVLAWLRDNVHESIPSRYYQLVLGHDLHVSLYGNLFARHFHAGWANPFNPDKLEAPIDPRFTTFFATHFGPKAHELTRGVCKLGMKCPALLKTEGAWRAEFSSIVGFIETVGWISGAKVTTAFRDEIIDELVSTTGTEFADFDFHEVGTSTTAENNTHTALQTTSGIARATGTPTDSTPDYDNVATITADATESWEEHGIFNNSSGAAMMDRNLTGGQSVNSSDQVEYDFALTVNAES